MKLKQLYAPLRIIKMLGKKKSEPMGKGGILRFKNRVMKPDTGYPGVSPETHFLPASNHRIVMPDRSV